jgi:hypothetical protein
MLMLSDFEDSDSDENYTKKRKIDETIQGNKTNFATDEIQPVYDSADFPLCKGLPRARFDIIYADPPFEYTRKVGSGVANNHYGLMTDTQLMAMGEEINLITTKDSALFMWCSGPTFNRALRLITAWGFTYKTIAYPSIATIASFTERNSPVSSTRIARPMRVAPTSVFSNWQRTAIASGVTDSPIGRGGF